jgi:hypothetical protein
VKRKIALLLAVIMLTAVFIPVQTFAAADNKGLERAIKLAKEKFTIPEDFKFDYNVYTENDKNVWYLNWTSKDDSGGSISVRIDDGGVILGYDSWKPYDYSQPRKLPKVSKQDAKKRADEFLERVNPGVLGSVKYQENNQNTLADYTYSFTYTRIFNDIPYYNNYASIGVNKDTGEVQNYYLNWTDGLDFPSAAGKITVEKAQEAYKNKLGLWMIYRYSYEDEKLKVYPVYTTRYDNGYYAVDALTGERLQLQEGYYGPYYGGGMQEVAKLEMSRSLGGGAAITLTPEEQKAVEEASKLITAGEAEKIARNLKYLSLTSDYKLQSSNLSRDWPARDEFVWYLYFAKESTEKDREYRHTNVTVDAKTGEVKSFYTSLPYNEKDKAKYDKAASKAAVESFLKEFKPVLSGQSEYMEDYSPYYPRHASGEAQTQYSFRYIRKINGIAFPDNAINVEYSAVHGKVISFNMNWFNIEFPPVDRAISLDSAYSRLYSDVGMELQYRPVYQQPSQDKPLIYSPDNAKPVVKLVYSLTPNLPLYFDANTGIMLNYDGKPYKPVKTAAYTDISGHYAEEKIKVLAEYGIALEGTELKPDSTISQKDFLALISKTMNNYYWQPLTTNSTQKEIDAFYSFLIREGVVRQEEKAPGSPITREDAVKYLIRSMKYDKVADIKGIFICSFKDKDQINPDLLGYVAIAGGLNIIDAGSSDFKPKAKLTREDALVMIYNYLQR